MSWPPLLLLSTLVTVVVSALLIRCALAQLCSVLCALQLRIASSIIDVCPGYNNATHDLYHILICIFECSANSTNLMVRDYPVFNFT